MANINTYLNNIKNALFGKDVRTSIHDGIDAINKEVEGTTKEQQKLSDTFKNLTINAGNSNAEIVAARGSKEWLPDRLDENEEKISVLKQNVDSIAIQIDETNLDDILKYNNILFKANCIINADVVIELKENAVIDFNNCTINGNLKLSRNKNCEFKGKVNVKDDTIIIGSVSNKFGIISTNFFYLQNYVGWGGVYWNTWEAIYCKAMQVRQAKIPNDTSSLNCNVINKLVAQHGLEKNNWINVWFRAKGTEFLYTEEGTSSELVGNAKWDIVTTNPFEINNLDLSYSNSEGITSYGIVNEGNRPLILRSGFIENINIAMSGLIDSNNIEIRNSDLNPISGDYNFKTSKLVGKIGGFEVESEPIVKNCEFGEGLNNFTKNGDVQIVKTNTAYNKYGRVCRITQNNSNISKLMYEFIAERTGYITILVRGVNIGDITCTDGNNSQYKLGNLKPNGKYGYSVGRASVTKGNKILISIYTPAYTELGTGEITDLTGFQVAYGKVGNTIYDRTTISSLPLSSSTTQNDWQRAFSIKYIKGAKTNIEFNVVGNIAGQGNIKGLYKGLIHVNDSNQLEVTDELKSFVYNRDSGGASDFDVRFVIVNNVIECQFAKGYYGTGCTANFIDIKVNDMFEIESIN